MPEELLEEEATHILEDLDVFKVDLVSRPATGDEFLVVRSEEEANGEMTREVFSSEFVRPIMVPIVGVERQVPAQDATIEKKREAQKKRSKKFGIEVLQDKGENLSYPSGKPTVERLYGDPVNLKYPLGNAKNELDKGRSTNARSRFKQAFAVYTKTKSRTIIHERIINAELKAGANPSYDPEDRLDKLLPKDLVEKMKSTVQREEETETNDMATMEELTEKVDGLVNRMEGVFSNLLKNADPEAAPVTPEAEASGEVDPEAEAAPVAPVAAEAPVTPVAAEAPATPEAAPVTPEAAPQPAVDAASQLGENIEKLGEIVERFSTSLGTLETTVGTVTKRLDKVERSLKSGGNAEPGDETEEINRDENGDGKSLFHNIL